VVSLVSWWFNLFVDASDSCRVGIAHQEASSRLSLHPRLKRRVKGRRRGTTTARRTPRECKERGQMQLLCGSLFFYVVFVVSWWFNLFVDASVSPDVRWLLPTLLFRASRAVMRY
jgi:hypothetical protein